MSSPAVMIATAKIRPGDEGAFAAWKGRHDAAVSAFPGFSSSDVMPPDGHDDAWTILLNFDSDDHLAAWQQSSERAGILAELAPLVVGGRLGEVMKKESSAAAEPGSTVTQVIFSRIKPGMENGYREWSARMQQAQSRSPGYRGTYLQPPAPGGAHWITMLRYDTAEHLNVWVAAPERAAMIEEGRSFIEGEELLRLATSFPGWVRINPDTGNAPPNWKTASLVLVGLYPIVVLQLIYMNPLISGLPFALVVFLGNVMSMAATSYLTMPFLVRTFDWWLFAGASRNDRANAIGMAILAALFTIEVGFLAWMFH